jgi:hypothetical protein
LISQGQAPLNVATGYMKPVSLIDPPSDAEAKAIFEEDKGRCSTWRKHIFNFSASVETPRFGNTAARVLGSGWRVSGIFRANSGSPLSVVTGTDRALSGIQPTIQRANQVLDNPYGDGTINNWLNPLAFALPALGTYGNSIRNAFDGPGRQVVDLSIVRSFRFTSGHRIEARVEAFNAFNWFLLDNPNTTLSSATFGRITSSGDPRIMQFAVKYDF